MIKSQNLKDRSWVSFWGGIKRDKYLILLLLPGLLYYIVFKYIPMYGIIIAFKDYQLQYTMLSSPFVGLKWFREFFSSFYFWRLIKNTLLISIYGLLWGFPIPIIFALILNEMNDGYYKRIVQTISYLPHFISLVVIVGLITQFMSPVDGVINLMLNKLGKESIGFLNEPKWFRTIYIGSGIWQSFGWNSIIYLAALSGIDVELYDAAKVDGASRFKQILHITLPGIASTIVILLILQMGSIMSVGFEKIILLYKPSTYEVADVISTYIYRRGILGAQYSFAAAVGLFNSVINLVILVTVNTISRRISEVSLW